MAIDVHSETMSMIKLALSDAKQQTAHLIEGKEIEQPILSLFNCTICGCEETRDQAFGVRFSMMNKYKLHKIGGDVCWRCELDNEAEVKQERYLGCKAICTCELCGGPEHDFNIMTNTRLNPESRIKLGKERANLCMNCYIAQ